MSALARATEINYDTRAANEDCINGGFRTRTKYLYEGSNFVQEQNVAGAATATLLTGGVDELFGRMIGAGISVPLTDALGNVIGETGSAQTVTTSFAYEPYGKATQTGTSSGNSQQYTGRENDGTDLYYYRARYYSPSTARFISEDPIGFGGGTNIYAYVDGDPISESDPLGLRPLTACEKSLLAPYVGTNDLNNADLHTDGIPWYIHMFQSGDVIGTTIGNKIYLKAGQYDPGTVEGLALLGHELVHVDQYAHGMTVAAYLRELVRNGAGRNNRYERPAYLEQDNILSDLRDTCACQK